MESALTLRSAWPVAHRVMSFVGMADALALVDSYELKTAVEVLKNTIILKSCVACLREYQLNLIC